MMNKFILTLALAGFTVLGISSLPQQSKAEIIDVGYCDWHNCNRNNWCEWHDCNRRWRHRDWCDWHDCDDWHPRHYRWHGQQQWGGGQQQWQGGGGQQQQQGGWGQQQQQ